MGVQKCSRTLGGVLVGVTAHRRGARRAVQLSERICPAADSTRSPLKLGLGPRVAFESPQTSS